MNSATGKQKNVGVNDAGEQMQRLLEERGSRALEEARKAIMREEVECKDVRDALDYFMQEYCRDLARPTLLSIVCEAVGGDPELTRPIAVPMILISGGIDIHDDIIDQSKVKGSRTTVLGKFGKDLALLVGDALLFEGLTLLHQAIEKGAPAEKLPVVVDVVKRMFFELGDAEAIELTFRGRIDVTPEEYLHVVRKKAADVEAHTRISAILGGGSEEEIENLGEYGRLLGMLIILRDDLIDMVDFEEAVHRFRRECLPLPILYALQNPKTKSTLTSILLNKSMTKKDANRVLQITNKEGGVGQVKSLMQNLAEDAYSHIKNLKRNKKYLCLLVREMLLPEY